MQPRYYLADSWFAQDQSSFRQDVTGFLGLSLSRSMWADNMAHPSYSLAMAQKFCQHTQVAFSSAHFQPVHFRPPMPQSSRRSLRDSSSWDLQFRAAKRLTWLRPMVWWLGIVWPGIS